MWKQIGIKTISSDRSFSQASSEHKYKRRIPFDDRDSIELMNLDSSRGYEREQERELMMSRISVKKDKELFALLKKGSEEKKTTSMIKINSESLDYMTNSVNHNLVRSNSDKMINLGSPHSLKCKKQSFTSRPQQKHGNMQQSQREIERLKRQLKKSKTLNEYLLNQFQKYKLLYQQLDILIKQKLTQYFRIQKQIIAQVYQTIQQISCPQLDSSSSCISKTIFPEIHHDHLNQQSVSKILLITQQMKKRILERQYPKKPEITKHRTVKGFFSPKAEKKYQNMLPAVQQFQQLINR